MPSVIEDDFVTIYGSCSGTKTYETIMGGTDLFALSRFMGHSDIKTTTKIYGHLIDEMRSTAANIMDAAISEYSRNA